MTSATSSYKGSGLGKFFSGRLFSDNNKRSWPVMLLLFLLIFFSCPVVMLLTLNYQSRNSSIGNIVNEMLGQPLSILMYIYAVIFALISVGVVMGYLHSKRSSYFYGSLPIKRGALFATQYVTGVIFFAVPFLVNVLLTLGVIGIFGAISTLSATVMWEWILNTLVLYMVVYSFAVLASNLSGMKSTSVMVMLLLFFYLPTLYFTILGYVSVLYRYIDADFLMSSMDVLKLSPIINTFYILQESTTLSGVITLLLYIIVPTLIALWLNHKLNAELSENAISFRRFQSTLKYAVIFPCAIVGALLFYALGELNGNGGLYNEMTPSGAAWLIFGAISGGLLSYMIINVILNKNFKALFDKFRNFGIFAAIFAVLFTLFAVDPIGVDRYVPSESSVSGVWFNNYYGNFNNTGNKINYTSSFTGNNGKRMITDKELIAQVNRISKIIIEYGESGDWKGNEADIWSSDMLTFRPVYKLGPLTLPKKMSIPSDLIQDELDKLTSDPEFVKFNYYPLLEDNLDEIVSENIKGKRFTLNTDNPAAEIYKYTDELQPNTSYDLSLEELLDLMKVIASDLKSAVVTQEKDTFVMQLSLNNYTSEYGYSNNENFYFNIGITEAFTNTINYLRDKGILDGDAIVKAADIIDTLTLYTGNSDIVVSDRDELVAILQNLSYYSEKDDAIRVTIRLDEESGDIEMGYIERDKLPDSIKARMSGI